MGRKGFPPRPACSRRDRLLARAEGAKFSGLGKMLNQSLVNEHFVPVDWWGQAVQLFAAEAQSWNVRVCVPLGHK